MRRRGVEVVIQLLDVLTVIAFVVGQSKEPLLENRIALIPQTQRETEPADVVANAR